MIKLVRNTLATYEVIYDAENRKIEWKYFVYLEKLNNESAYQFTNKLNKRHIQWKDRIMHVRTAVETLSNSAANAMQYALDSGAESFQNASATIKFIRTFNDLFDICNTFRRQDSHSNQYKSALNTINQEAVFRRLHEIKQYILNLKMRKSKDIPRIVSVLESDRKTAFRGFIMSIISIEGIYRDYVEKRYMSCFPTFRISQDHLETFFSKVRARNGQNENPTCQQFTAAYRKLLHQPNVACPKLGNISLVDEAEDQPDFLKNVSNILTISSRCKKDSEQSEEQFTTDSTPNLESVERISHFVEVLDDAGIAFIASMLERKLLDCGQIYCQQCKHILEDNTKLAPRQCVGGFSPCVGTFKICKAVAKALKIYSHSKSCKNRVLGDVLLNLDASSLYSDDNPDSHEAAHIDYIIQYIIDSYIRISQNREAKNETMNLQNRFLRQQYKNKVKFSGQ